MIIEVTKTSIIAICYDVGMTDHAEFLGRDSADPAVPAPRHQLERILDGEVALCSYDYEQRKLTIRGAVKFPMQILDFGQDIEILDMSHGELSELPADIARLEKLKVAFFSENKFTTVPRSLGSCANLEMLGMKSCALTELPADALPANLRWLTLTDNALEKLPSSIGQMSRLEKLLVAGNHLRNIPKELGLCRALRLIRLGSNQLIESPDWLLDLPDLAWFGDAGNPYSPSEKQVTLPGVAWNQIELGEKIGQSAQNIVYRAILMATGEEVAVKLFGGDVTSDGLPENDMTAGALAGNHTNLVGVVGQVVDHPDGKKAVLLPLVPPQYTPLAQPPSLKTCTRDTFPDGVSFSVEFVESVVRGIASAAQHLHEKGIMHGDLYGHNILSDELGNSLLTDFGAASIYDPSTSDARERIDTHAFGYLLDDLLTKVPQDQRDSAVYRELSALKQMCLSGDVANRPLFRDLI